MILEQKFAYDQLDKYIHNALTQLKHDENCEIEYDQYENCYLITFKNDVCLRIEIHLITKFSDEYVIGH